MKCLVIVIAFFTYCDVVFTTYNAKNVEGRRLQPCSFSPLTGWYRDGYCNTDFWDRGSHVVCAKVTDDFLDYTNSKGNDLSTARGSFPGLRSGDHWCLCAVRWKEAYDAGYVIPVNMNATHEKALRIISKDVLALISE